MNVINYLWNCDNVMTLHLIEHLLSFCVTRRLDIPLVFPLSLIILVFSSPFLMERTKTI